MIRISDVHLTLNSDAGPVQILKGVDLEVAAGEAVSVVGPSGSGKSSLLALVGGIERPTRGTIAIDGTDLAGLDEDGLAVFRRERIGILFQSFHLLPTMSAIENVALPLELAGVDHAFERARERLAEVGLERRQGHYPTQLSGGEQQRVALARALAPEPPILVADEPTGNLDEATGRQVMDLIFSVHRARGTTLVLVTHDAALARRCSRVLRLRSGVIEEDSRSGLEVAAR